MSKQTFVIEVSREPEAGESLAQHARKVLKVGARMGIAKTVKIGPAQIKQRDRVDYEVDALSDAEAIQESKDLIAYWMDHYELAA
jgi:hypothetical protein